MSRSMTHIMLCMHPTCITILIVNKQCHVYTQLCMNPITILNIRSRLDRSVELRANAFQEDDVHNTQILNESEVM